ncbi:hypothetical protein L228DRAFT_118352 [Xylona heveae TC161]|uniref:Uncharacterized protein n=1 Tax=Xylona heveae (strain CBS 132557 / TC161) TaxID=1328760 RepID=A0A161TCL5_XYLHT|nr:hypothetical protein L228DRAFT_118352 [Xylona heveae TC161]KZF23537.1 hypothetical protein L228DRAFT_118352 [Xylona heveae TC161]
MNPSNASVKGDRQTLGPGEVWWWDPGAANYSFVLIKKYSPALRVQKRGKGQNGYKIDNVSKKAMACVDCGKRMRSRGGKPVKLRVANLGKSRWKQPLKKKQNAFWLMTASPARLRVPLLSVGFRRGRLLYRYVSLVFLSHLQYCSSIQPFPSAIIALVGVVGSQSNLLSHSP